MRILTIGRGDRVHITSRVKGIMDEGCDVTLMTLFPSTNQGIRHYFPEKPPSWPGPLRFFQDLNILFNNIRILKTLNFDAYHIHNAAKVDAWTMLAAGKRPLIVSLMGGDIHFEDRNDFTLPFHSRLLIRLLLKNADLVTVKSGAMKEAAMRHGATDKKIETIIWGIDTNKFYRQETSPLRKQLGIPQKRKIIFSPRFLKPFYNIDMIVDAFRMALSEEPDIHLLLASGISDDRYEEVIRQQVSDLGIQDRVIFLGDIRHEDMPSYFSLADLTINLPPSDGMPQSLLESLACCTPAILTNLQQYKDIVGDGESALLTPLETNEVAKAIVTLLQSPELLRTMGENGRMTVCAKADMQKECKRFAERVSRLVISPTGETPRLDKWLSIALLTIHISSLISRNLTRRVLSLFRGVFNK